MTEHLPHNEMNPQCYKNAGNTGRIPYAGWFSWFI